MVSSSTTTYLLDGAAKGCVVADDVDRAGGELPQGRGQRSVFVRRGNAVALEPDQEIGRPTPLHDHRPLAQRRERHVVDPRRVPTVHAVRVEGQYQGVAVLRHQVEELEIPRGVLGEHDPKVVSAKA